MRLLVASPLLWEINAAHEKLQSAFQELVDHDDEYLSDGIDLVERMKTLESSFGAF